LKKLSCSRKTLEGFLSDLSSESGAPGGGAAAALAGALGISLIEMTVRINARRTPNTDKKKFNRKVKWLRWARRTLLDSMDKDVQAFEKIAALYRKKEKGPAWQGALKKGAVVPYQIAEITAGAGHLVREETPRTSAWLVSDLKEATYLLRAAFLSAELNVEANLKEIQDKRLVTRMRKALREMKSNGRYADESAR
jgi:formiminotetrahydrofolate cyclodeaminase